MLPAPEPSRYLRWLTITHVAISLLGIASGFVVAWGMLNGAPMPEWTVFFFATTIATSATGFFFPFQKFLPSHLFGIISLVVLPLAAYARYGGDLAGGWRWIYVSGALFAQYLNVFVLVVQLFQKVTVLKPLAPTQKEPPFLLAQLVLLVAFAALGYFALQHFPR